MTVKSGDIHKGHRQRMRRRLSENGERMFDTYELFEMLLYHVVAYKDTNPMAKMLIAELGDIEGVMSASAEELMQVPGVGRGVADFICKVGRLTENVSVCGDEDNVSYDDYYRLGEMIVDFFEKQFTDSNCVAIFLFDNGMQLIGSKKLYDLDYSSGGVRADKFLEYAISSRAAVAVTAHLHKHGTVVPSLGDKETNDLVTDALEGAGIMHLEHFVVSGGKYLGMMTRLVKSFAQSPAIERFVMSKRRLEYAER